jgi:hypothetical protein
MLRCITVLTMLLCCALAVRPSSEPLTKGISLLEKGDARGALPLLRPAVEESTVAFGLLRLV